MGLLGKFPSGHNAIGIDIGSHSIKVVQLAPTRNGYVVNCAGSTPTPVDAIKQGVVDDRLAVAEALRSLLDTLRITTPWAVAAVAGPTVVVRQVSLPMMPEGQLRKSINWEARNHISFPVEDSTVSFQILGTTTVDGTPQMDVMLVATPRELVDSRVEALEQAGLEPIAVELEPFALMRTALELPLRGEYPQETVALVSIGGTYTHISIVSNGQFVLSRSVTVAGDSFTAAIASALGVDTAQAEEIKTTEARAVSSEEERAQLSPIGQQASRALDPQLEELVREIRRSFAFYDYQQTPGGSTADSVSRIILTGGSANLPGLADCMNDQLSIRVETLDMFDKDVVQVPDNEDELHTQRSLLSTAFGLALRESMLGRDKGGTR
jgi:type IV pilus assembly protein PilM